MTNDERVESRKSKVKRRVVSSLDIKAGITNSFQAKFLLAKGACGRLPARFLSGAPLAAHRVIRHIFFARKKGCRCYRSRNRAGSFPNSFNHQNRRKSHNAQDKVGPRE